MNSGAGTLPEDENTPANPTDGSIQSVESSPSDVQDTPDGGAIVTLDESAPDEPKLKFYDNLAPTLQPSVLSSLNAELDERIKADKTSREDRDKQYAEGIKRTGLGKDAPGGAEFSGASKVVHPVLTKAAIDFEARAIAELMPPAGPVKEYIPSPEVKQAQADKARRKSAHMNWQLTKQMPEFRPELEQCLSQVGLAGSQFMYMNWDPKRRRPVATYWPSDDVIIPYGSSSALMSERLTMVEHITQRTYDQRVKSKYYSDPADAASVLVPEQTQAAKAAEKVEGVKPDILNKDGLRDIWRVFTELELEDDPVTKGELAPYIVEMNTDLGGIKRIIRNWEEDDDLRLSMTWLIEFPFLPWRGALSIGLVHVIGTLSGAATGALRSLLDSALINNFPAVLKLKGANFSGQTKQMSFGTMVEMEGGIGGTVDDIRKLVMPIPYNPPSAVLMELLGVLGTEAESVVQTTLKNLTDAASNTLPVGTTLALIEQGMKVFAGVHLRLLHAMTQLLQVLHRINRMYLTDAEVMDEAGTALALKADYDGPMDVIPVADPNIFSDAQRFAQMQVVADRAQQYPQIYNVRETEKRILKLTRIPDAENLLLPDSGPQDMNAVNENSSMAMGRPVFAYPEQDHLAHIQVHLDFANSPVLGQLPNIAPKFMQQCIDHIAQHIALWYVNTMYKGGTAATGKPLEQLMGTKDPEAEQELDKLLAHLSPASVKAADEHFGQFPQILAQLQKIADQYKPPAPPPDPSMAVAQVAAGVKQADIQARTQETTAKLASNEKVTQLKVVGDAQKAQQAQALKAAADARLQAQKDAAAGQRAQEDNLVKETINQEDNQTALTISAAELAGGHKSGVSTGTGINP